MVKHLQDWINRSSLLVLLYNAARVLRRPHPELLNPYVNITALKPITVTVEKEPPKKKPKKLPPFTVMVTVLNEEASIGALLESIKKQSFHPVETIIVDGGSTDKTLTVIDRVKKRLRLKLSVYVMPKRNIPEGANFAIMQAKTEIIVSIHAGCILTPKFFEYLVGSMAEHPKADLVGGIYVSYWGEKNTHFIPHWKTVDWNIFLPSIRACCFRKSVAIRSGLFPKHLDVGEDTLFDMSYRRNSKQWVFNTNAVVRWKNPRNRADYRRLLQKYAAGDGLTGIGWYLYYTHYRYYEGIHPDADTYIKGYRLGENRQVIHDIAVRKINGYVFYFADEMLFEHALDPKNLRTLAKHIEKGWRVIYVSPTLYVKKDMIEEKRRYIPLDFAELVLYPIETFDPYMFAREIKRYGLGVKVVSNYTGNMWTHKVRTIKSLDPLF